MSAATQTPPAIARPATLMQPPLFRLSAEQYLAMAEAEIIGPGDRVELIDGVMVAKMPSSPLHNGVLMALIAVLGRLCGAEHCLRCQMGLILPGENVPEPDLTVVRGGPRDFFAAQAAASQAQLVVEVSRSSLEYDLGDKMRLYADAGIPEYWVVDIEAKQVHVHTNPQPGGYAAVAVVGVGGTLPVALGGAAAGSIAAEEFLP